MRCAIVGSIACLVFTVPAFAANVVWGGGAGTGLWSDTANWSPSGLPAATADLQFNGAGSFAIDSGGNRTVNSLLFSGNSSYALSNNTITLTSGNLTTLSPASGSVSHFVGSNLNFTSPAAISVGAGTVLNLTGVLTTTGLTKSDNGTLRLGGANTFGGNITVSGGVLAIGTSGATGSITADVVNNATLIFNRNTDYAYAGAISGTGTVYKVNSNTLTLSGNNTYSGSTQIEGGTLVFSSGSLGNGAIRLSAGGLKWATGNTLDISSRTLTIDAGGATFDTNGNNVTFANAIGNSGSGGLTKAGNGTLTLGGTNTYSGTTTISGGTLKLTALSAVPGDIVNNAALLLSTSGTLAGDISGNGSVTAASGANTVISFNSAWTHTGGTTVSSGRLRLLNDASLAGNVTVSSGGSLWFDGSGARTASNTITGSGSIRALAGTLTLTGNNSGFSGSVYVEAGSTLEFSSVSNLGTGRLTGFGGTFKWAAGSSADISTLTIDPQALDSISLNTNGNDVLLANSFGDSSSGAIYKSGAGKLTYGGDTTYTGSTVVSAGSLQIGNGAAGGSILGNLTNNSAVIWNRSDSVTYAKIISGTGSLTQAGSGTLILSGNNTYSGGTTVSTGTLQIGAGSTAGSISGDVVNNGTLAFNRSDSTTFSGNISGSGALSLVDGTLTLTGTNSYAGGTTIAGDSSLKIGNGGTTGSITGDTVNSGYLFFNRSDDLTYAGKLTSDGRVFHTGAGTLTLSNSANVLAGLAINGPARMATATTSYTDIGVYYWGNSGTLTVDGNGTAFTVTGDLTAGNSKTGTLNVSGGASSTAANATIGIGNNGTGIVNVSGAGSTWTVAGAINLASIGSNVSGALNLSAGGKISAGTLDGTGTVSFDNGTLALTQTDSAAHTFALASGGGTLETAAGKVLSASGSITGAGALTKTGNGTLILTGNASHSGGTTVSAGTLQIGAGGTAGAISGNILNNATLVFNRSDEVTYAGAISGSGNISIQSSITFTGNHTSTGTTTVTGDSNVLIIGNGGTSGALTGNLNFSNQVWFNRSTDSTYPGVFSRGTTVFYGDLYKYGAGTLTLSGNGSQLSQMRITGGGIRVDSGGSLQLAEILAGYYGDGTFSADGTGTTVRGSTVEVGNNALGTVNFTNAASGIFTGDLNLYNGSDSLNISSGAKVTVATLSGSGAVRLNNGTLALSETASTSTPITLNAGGGTLEVAAGKTVTASAALSGTGSLTKSGPGKFILDGAASYTAGTTVSAGTLLVTNVFPSSGNVTVAAGATLSSVPILYLDDTVVNNGLIDAPETVVSGSVSGAGSYTGTLSIFGSYSPGNSPASVSLESFSLLNNAQLHMEIGGPVAGSGYDQLLFSGSGQFGGTLFVELINGYTPAAGTVFNLFSGNSTGTFSSVVLPAGQWDVTNLYSAGQITAVPEPSACVLLALSVSVLGLSRRSRKPYGVRQSSGAFN